MSTLPLLELRRVGLAVRHRLDGDVVAVLLEDRGVDLGQDVVLGEAGLDDRDRAAFGAALADVATRSRCRRRCRSRQSARPSAERPRRPPGGVDVEYA